MKDFFLRFILVSNLRTAAQYVAAKDADNEGSDDRLARILLNAADEIEKYLDEQAKKNTVR